MPPDKNHLIGVKNDWTLKTIARLSQPNFAAGS
jgi:hypothetical protein